MECIFCGKNEVQVIQIANRVLVQISYRAQCFHCWGKGQEHKTKELAVMEWEAILEALHDSNTAQKGAI